MIIVIFIVVFWGLSYLCAGMEKHGKQIFSFNIATSIGKKLQLSGYLLLFFGLLLCLFYWGTGVGSVFFLGTISSMHFILILMLSYYPKYLGLLTGLNFIIKPAC